MFVVNAVIFNNKGKGKCCISHQRIKELNDREVGSLVIDDRGWNGCDYMSDAGGI